MTKYLVEKQTLTDIADAIREQTGDSNPIMLSSFASAISGISGDSHEYSTDEQEVGTWIDGSPVYEKVVDLGYLPNNTTKNVAHNISNLGLIISADFVAKDTSGQYVFMPHVVANRDYIGYQVSVYATSTNIVIEVGSNRSAYSGYAILRYTKASASLLNSTQSEESEGSENE